MSGPGQRLKKLTAGKKGAKILIILGFAGIMLIFLSSFIPSSNTVKEKEISSDQSLDEYSKNLEARLCEIIGKINGVGKCQVFVTLERGTEYIYAKEEKKSDDSSTTSGTQEYSEGRKSSGEQQYIIIDTEDGEQALLVTQIAPKVKGVIVVCDGGGSEAVRSGITAAVTAALDVPASRVCVGQRSERK